MSDPNKRAAPEQVDQLIRHVYLVTFDEQDTIIDDGAIAIRGAEIVAIGADSDLARRYHADRTIDGAGRIAIPGLTDAHYHTGQALMRGVFPELTKGGPLRMPPWREYLLPFEMELSPEDQYISGMFGYGTMLLSGTTAFWEAGGNHPLAMGQAAIDAGIRGIVGPYGRDCTDERVPAGARTDAEGGIAENVAIVEALPPGRRVSGGMSLAQTSTASPALVAGTVAEARKRGVKVHMHLAEGTYEVDQCLEAYNKRPVQYMIDLDAFDETMHFAHAVLVGPREVGQFVANGPGMGPSVCHCPNGNYRIGWAPVLDMIERGVTLGIGTDGACSSGSLDLFRLMNVAKVGQELVYGTRIHTREPAPAGSYLRAAITGGATAMGSGAGVLAPGRKADIVLLDVDSPDAALYPRLSTFLFDAASGRDVESVWVDGQQVVAEHTLLTMDINEIAAKAGQVQDRILRVIA